MSFLSTAKTRQCHITLNRLIISFNRIIPIFPLNLIRIFKTNLIYFITFNLTISIILSLTWLDVIVAAFKFVARVIAELKLRASSLKPRMMSSEIPETN